MANAKGYFQHLIKNYFIKNEYKNENYLRLKTVKNIQNLEIPTKFTCFYTKNRPRFEFKSSFYLISVNQYFLSELNFSKEIAFSKVFLKVFILSEVDM